MANVVWRDDFFWQIGRFVAIGPGTARQILRHANTLQRAAEVDCSVSNVDVRLYWAERAKRARLALKSLGETWSFNVSCSGDPRGAVVKLYPLGASVAELDAGTVSWAINVPSVGFTAAQIERLSGDRRLSYALN